MSISNFWTIKNAKSPYYCVRMLTHTAFRPERMSKGSCHHNVSAFDKLNSTPAFQPMQAIFELFVMFEMFQALYANRLGHLCLADSTASPFQ